MSVLLITTDTEGFIIHHKFSNINELEATLEEDYNVETCRESGYNPQPHVVTESLNVGRFDDMGYQYF